MTEDTTMQPNSEPFAAPVERPVRPLVWARKDQLQYASTRGGLMCAMYPNTDRRADLQPLYDAAAVEALVRAAVECAVEVCVNATGQRRSVDLFVNKTDLGNKVLALAHGLGYGA